MWRVLIDIILPRKCHSCGEELRDEEAGICLRCLRRMPTTGYYARSSNPVEQRLAGKVRFERASSWLFYSPDSVVARLIHDFKYRGFSSLARNLGALMATDLEKSGWLEGIDFIMGVPQHWLKLLKRGYSQTRELAIGISRVTGAEVSTDLRARRHHRSQTRMSGEERLRNVNGVFHLDHPERYSGKTILLVDDVCTTGGTVSAAGRAIADACPDCRIVILTLATIF